MGSLASLIKMDKLDTIKTKRHWGTNEENVEYTISDHRLKSKQQKIFRLNHPAPWELNLQLSPVIFLTFL